MHPIRDENYGESAVWTALVVLAVASLVQTLVVGLALPRFRARLNQPMLIGLQAAVLPILTIIWGIALAPAHKQQDDAVRIFKVYTHRFPAGRLREYEIEVRGTLFTSVCAQEGPQFRRAGSARVYDPRSFCAWIAAERTSSGKRVLGGYRITGEVRQPDAVASDCFGLPRALTTDRGGCAR